MAALSSAVVTLSLRPHPSPRFASLSSSTSAFFSDHVRARTGLSLSKPLPGVSKKRGMSCNCMFGLGVPELVVIAGVAVLVFGPKKLPEVGRSIGKTLKGFQQAAKEFETELKKDEEPTAEESGEQITTVSEEKEKESKVPSTKENS